MKDESITNLEMNLPSVEGDAAIETCLQALYDDTTHCMTDEFAPHATYGELVDALLAARDALDNVRELKAEAVNDEWLDDYDNEFLVDEDWNGIALDEDWGHDEFDEDDFDDDDFDDELESVVADLDDDFAVVLEERDK